jgi:DedD protein
VETKASAESAADKGAASTATTPPAIADAPAAPPTPASAQQAPSSQPIVSAPPGKSLAEAEQRVMSPATKPAPKVEAPTKPAPPAEPAPQPTAKSAPAPVTTPVPTATAPERPDPKAKAESNSDTEAPAAATPTGYAVQLAAFADDKGANALAAKLRKSGYAAYTEAVQTSRGTLWRVRVGGYATREAAVAARDKLKAEGQNGIVAPAK